MLGRKLLTQRDTSKFFIIFPLFLMVIFIGIFFDEYSIYITAISVAVCLIVFFITQTKLSIIHVLFYCYVILLPLHLIAAKLLYIRIMGRVIAIYDIMLIMMFLIFLIELMAGSKRLKFHFFDKYILLLFFINVAFFVKGVVHGNDRAFSDFRAVSLFLFLYFPAILIFKELSDIYNIIVFIFYYAGFIAILALMERFGIGSTFFLALSIEEHAMYGAGDPTATFGTEMYRTGRTVGYNFAGSAIVFGFLFFLDKTLFRKYFPFMPMWFVVYVLNFAVVILTKIKSYVLIPANLLVILFIIKFYSPVKSQLKINRVCSLILVSVVSLGVAILFLPKDWQHLVGRFDELYYTYGTNEETSSLKMRKLYAEADFQSFKKSPFFGNGLGYRNFLYIPERNSYYMATGEVAVPFTLAMTGMVGYASVNAILLWLGWHGFKIFRNSRNIAESFIAASFFYGSIMRPFQSHIWSEDSCFFYVMMVLFLRIFSIKQAEGKIP